MRRAGLSPLRIANGCFIRGTTPSATVCQSADALLDRFVANDDFAFIAGADERQFSVIDLQDPGALAVPDSAALVGRYDGGVGYAVSLALKNDIVFLASSHNGLQLIGASAPTAPQAIQTLALDAAFEAVQ